MRSIETEVINTPNQISNLVDRLLLLHAPPVPNSPIMYIDLEGVDLCREGSVSILTLLIDTGIPSTRVCLIDVHIMGAQAFNTAGAKGKTLRDILQDVTMPKVFFDIRNDSDALFAHFGVALQGIEDIQIMESATRKTTASRKLLNGLAKCVEHNVVFSFGHGGLATWRLAKGRGERLFKVQHGGSYEVFNQRPIPKDIIAYCVGDVQYLPELRDKLCKGKPHRWQELVRETTMKRVAMSQKPEYQPHGPDRAVAPWSKEQNSDLDQLNYVPPDRKLDDIFDLHDDWDDELYEDYWEDDGPTSCRDIIPERDMEYYYSD